MNLRFEPHHDLTWEVFRGSLFIGYARLHKPNGRFYAAALYKNPDGSDKGRCGAFVETREEAAAELLTWLPK